MVSSSSRSFEREGANAVVLRVCVFSCGNSDECEYSKTSLPKKYQKTPDIFPSLSERRSMGVVKMQDEQREECSCS